MAKHDFFAARYVCGAARGDREAMTKAQRQRSPVRRVPRRNVSAKDLLQGFSDFETLEIELSNRLLVTSEISPLSCAKCEKTLGQV